MRRAQPLLLLAAVLGPSAVQAQVAPYPYPYSYPQPGFPYPGGAPAAIADQHRYENERIRLQAQANAALARRLDTEAAQRRLTLEAARQATAAPAPSVHDLRPVAPPASPSTSPPPTASEPRRSLSEIDAWLDRPR